MIDFEKLKAPFDPAKVSWRVGAVTKDGTKAMALAYVDARDVMERLDEVCTPAGWQDEYPEIGTTTVCKISLKIDSEWVSKTDGAGTTDVEAEKGQLSDAFKRCAVKWGIGRYLYDIKSPWVEIDQFKKFTPAAQERLISVLQTGGLKQHTLEGQSKKPAGFWGGGNLFLVPPKKYEANEPAALSWRIEQFRAGVDKAPTRDLLAKFQEDNAIWLDKLESTKTQELYEVCAVRASQFDQLNGGQ